MALETAFGAEEETGRMRGGVAFTITERVGGMVESGEEVG